MTMEPKIQELLDKQAITELCLRYSRAVDRLDKNALKAVYWPDATDDHGDFAGPAHDYVDWCIDRLSPWVSSQHSNTNFLIEIDGDSACGEVHWIGFYVYEIDGKRHRHIGVGRYIDRYEKRDGDWRILHRMMTWDWPRMQIAADDGPLVAPVNAGRRGAEDPVFLGPMVGAELRARLGLTP